MNNLLHFRTLTAWPMIQSRSTHPKKSRKIPELINQIQIYVSEVQAKR